MVVTFKMFSPKTYNRLLSWAGKLQEVFYPSCGLTVCGTKYSHHGNLCSKNELISYIFLNCDMHYIITWRHNGHDSVSNLQPHHCLLNRLFRCRSKKTSKLRVTELCAGNSPGTGDFPAQMASNAEKFSAWWRHHDNKSCEVVLTVMPQNTRVVKNSYIICINISTCLTRCMLMCWRRLFQIQTIICSKVCCSL